MAHDASNSKKLTDLLCRWLAKETRGLLGGVVGGLIGGLIAFTAINYTGRLATLSSSDAISIANTYIVYTTFVIAAVALLLTIAGLIFTQHFAVEKESHIAHAFSCVLDVVRTNDEKAVILVQQAMENPRVVEYVSEALQAKISQEVDALKASAGARARNARQEADALNSMFDDLSAAKNGPKEQRDE